MANHSNETMFHNIFDCLGCDFGQKPTKCILLFPVAHSYVISYLVLHLYPKSMMINRLQKWTILFAGFLLACNASKHHFSGLIPV